VVGAEVDDLGGRRQAGGQRGGRAVREGEEDQVGAGQGDRVGRHETAVGQRRQLRVHRAHRLAGRRLRRKRPELDGGVPDEQAQQLPSCVPAGAGNGDPDTHDFPFMR